MDDRAIPHVHLLRRRAGFAFSPLACDLLLPVAWYKIVTPWPKKGHILMANRAVFDNLSDQDSKLSRSTPQQTNLREQTFWAKHQTIINFWLDSFLLLNFLSLLWVTVVVHFVFPRATIASGYTLWGMAIGQWMDIQFGLVAILCLGILLHLMLHWSWVCGVLGRRILRGRDGKKRVMDDGQRTILGVGVMIVLLNIMGLGIAAAALAIKSPL